MLYPLYVISGISGSGKTTLGKLVSKEIKNARFVDQDEFYIGKKPQIKLSDGTVANNWDCLEALDTEGLKVFLKMELKTNPVVLVGFALIRDIIPVIPTAHIHLITANNASDLEYRCRFARIQAKPEINKQVDELMVKEVVIPFYHNVVRNSDITDIVPVFDGIGERIPVKTLVKQLCKIIKKTKKVRISRYDMDVTNECFDQIKEGLKSIEERLISNKYKIKCADMITLINSKNEKFDVTVGKVRYYLPNCGNVLSEFLKQEPLDKTLPGIKSIEEARKFYLQWSTEQCINQSGMMAVYINPI